MTAAGSVLAVVSGLTVAGSVLAVTSVRDVDVLCLRVDGVMAEVEFRLAGLLVAERDVNLPAAAAGTARLV